MPDFHVHWLAVAAGTVVYFVLGAAWYGALAGPWLKALGTTKEEVKEQDVSWVYGVQFLSTLLMVILASWVLHDGLGVDDAATGLLGGVLLGVIASLASSGDFLYEERRRSLSLYLINSGYRVVAMAALGVLVGLLA